MSTKSYVFKADDNTLFASYVWPYNYN